MLLEMDGKIEYDCQQTKNATATTPASLVACVSRSELHEGLRPAFQVHFDV